MRKEVFNIAHHPSPDKLTYLPSSFLLHSLKFRKHSSVFMTFCALSEDALRMSRHPTGGLGGWEQGEVT